MSHILKVKDIGELTIREYRANPQMHTLKIVQGPFCDLIEKCIGARGGKMRVDKNELLRSSLNNLTDPIRLVNRQPQVVFEAVRRLESSGWANKPGLVSCVGCRGSGKTAFLRRILLDHFAERMECGRVLVADAPLYTTTHDSAASLLRKLVAMHLQRLSIGIRIPEGTECRQLIEIWRQASRDKFALSEEESCALKPLIVIDTAEVWAAPTPIRSSSHNRSLTLLEHVAASLPPLHVVLSAGTSADIGFDNSVVLTQLNMSVLADKLPPLQLDQIIEAAQLWEPSRLVDDMSSSVTAFVYGATAGLPRPLRIAAQLPLTTTLLFGAAKAYPTSVRQFLKECALANMDVKSLVEGTDCLVVAQCAAAAAVKWKAEPLGKCPFQFRGEAIPWIKFVLATGGTWGTDGPVFPSAALYQCDFTKMDRELNTVMPGVKISALHCCATETYVTTISQAAASPLPAKYRGRVFEGAVIHAIVARYFLCRAQNGSSWVGLSDVLANQAAASVAVLQKYEVNLECGLLTGQHAKAQLPIQHHLAWNANFPTAHHDALMCGRLHDSKNECWIALQLRHGKAKSNKELSDTSQAYVAKDRKQVLSGALICALRCDPGPDNSVADEGLQRLVAERRFCYVNCAQFCMTAHVDAVTPLLFDSDPSAQGKM
jgi:hypothetical protein